jgi:peptide deformylase
MVERPVSALIRGQDVRGKRVRVKAEGFLARAFLHEIDHLNGVLYVDLAEEGTVMTVEEYEQLVQEQRAEQELEAETEQEVPVNVSAC